LFLRCKKKQLRHMFLKSKARIRLAASCMPPVNTSARNNSHVYKERTTGMGFLKSWKSITVAGA
jgi:hypothetical protein